jgi:hypothetical protein
VELIDPLIRPPKSLAAGTVEVNRKTRSVARAKKWCGPT